MKKIFIILAMGMMIGCATGQNDLDHVGGNKLVTDVYLSTGGVIDPESKRVINTFKSVEFWEGFLSAPW